MNKVSGRAPTGQALAVPVEPVARLDPTGFDPSRDGLAHSLRTAWQWCSGYEPSWSLLLKEADEAADRLDKLEAENALLKGLISEESIEAMAQDIACAVMDGGYNVTATRHSAMVRLGKRLREPLPVDLRRTAQAIEARRAETSGSVEDESAVAESDAP
jgi:hypothetical protein